ncbi:ATP12 family chaperone protein [Limobrevibacterium gyesilva]|uniref:ATP12 family chaperone protein n=1 Tax=Limobrevibacterium gyesilva TaxID=2991712 RepID=A0AA42CFP7_9PROT|nr:ATP12 family chaperone protein [Limobrevibacterium gyesilva]MCW3472985.1 ATP12 family chaperone protein [Limobrevibacterium gyesilva]
MKRFWTQASITPHGPGWQVLLDGKPVRLPGGAPLRLDSPALAQAVAAEWQAAGGGKGGEMSYADVPLTRLAGTAQERIAPDPEPVVLELARYAESDLLCYRAEQPAALVQRQQAGWQPWLDWAESRFAARLRVTAGVMYVPQDPQALAALAQAVAALDAWALAALGIAVPGTGSLVLGLAMAEGVLDPAAAHALATLDETFQEELWGTDDEARDRRRRIAADLATAGRFLALARPDTGTGAA